MFPFKTYTAQWFLKTRVKAFSLKNSLLSRNYILETGLKEHLPCLNPHNSSNLTFQQTNYRHLAVQSVGLQNAVECFKDHSHTGS